MPAERTIRHEGAVGLDRVSKPALVALWEAMIAAQDRTAEDRDLRVAPYVAARRHPRTRRLVILAEGVARELVRYLIGTSPANEAERAVALLAAELGLGPVVAPRNRWDVAAGPAAALLREIALDEFGLGLDVVLPPRDAGFPEIAIVWYPASPALMRTTLMHHVLQDAAASVAADPLVRLEHRAAAWWFDCWTPGLPSHPGRALTAALARELRCTEWCAAGRSTSAHGEPIVATFWSHRGAGGSSLARREIARALCHSVSSLFVVRFRAGERSVFEEVLSGERLHVMEHRPETAYQPGNFGLGRVVPLGADTHVRSPGMVFYAHPDPAVMEALRAEFRDAAVQLGPEIAVERIIALSSGERSGPRDTAPAESAEEAQRLMDEAWRLLRSRLGGVKRKPLPDHPRDLLAQVAAGETEVREFMLDRPMAEWISALTRQARPPEIDPPRG